MVFNRRQRERLAALGITGPASFNGATPDRWEAIGLQKLREDMRKRHDCLPSGPLAADIAGPLLRYVEAGIAGELQKVSEATEARRDTQVMSPRSRFGACARPRIWSLDRRADQRDAERFLEAASMLCDDQDGTLFIDIAAESGSAAKTTRGARPALVAQGKATA
jgi:hypothetical protein